MASSRFATAMTWSAGTNRNSASRSMKRLISHGHAIRSTRAFSRVIHFMVVSWTLRGKIQLTHLIDRRTMACRQKGVDVVARRGEGRGVRAFFRQHRSDPLHCPGIEHVDHARIANRDVELVALAVEKNHIGLAAQLLPTDRLA